ncbi:hypothetical protein PM082_004475 [Marasmius tenuissimus]|nr:hypothetical protein PM082_004475 [Marasmius tenuissimus]
MNKPKKAKLNLSTVGRIIAMANATSSTPMSFADIESNRGYRPGQCGQQSVASSSSGPLSASNSKVKGKAREVPEFFEFGKVFVFIDRCSRSKAKNGKWDFIFKSSSCTTKPVPSPAEFDQALHHGCAAECDVQEGPWRLPLDMEADDVMDFLCSSLPDLISHLRSVKPVPNKDFLEEMDSEHKRFLPPLIPLVSTRGHRLAISAGACEYPPTTFAQNLSWLSPNRSKGGPLASLTHTHFLLTRSTIGKGDTRSWNRPSRTLPPQSTQPRNKAKSDDKDWDTINDFTESEADQGSSPIDNNGGSESVYNDTDSVVEEVKPVKRNLRK